MHLYHHVTQREGRGSTNLAWDHYLGGFNNLMLLQIVKLFTGRQTERTWMAKVHIEKIKRFFKFYGYRYGQNVQTDDLEG